MYTLPDYYISLLLYMFGCERELHKPMRITTTTPQKNKPKITTGNTAEHGSGDFWSNILQLLRIGM